MEKILKWWKKTDKQKLLLHYVLPFILLSGLSFAYGITVGSGLSGKGGSQSYKELKTPIASTVDLPAQMKELQSQEVLLLQAQLDSVKMDNQSDVADVITTVTQNNKIDDFMTALIALDPNADIETQFDKVSPFYAKNDFQTNGISPSENIYTMLGGDSWAKEKGSLSAKAGSSIISVLTGSTNDVRYYSVLTPVSNEKRETATVLYFIASNGNGDILNCIYAGVVDTGNVYEGAKSLYINEK